MLESALANASSGEGASPVNASNDGQVRALNFAFEELTDEGLSQLERCAELERLGLFSTSITDAGLVHLQGCPPGRGPDFGKEAAGVQELGALADPPP